MIAHRLLLPFTRGIDTKAIEHALHFARASQSTLVALALIADTKLAQGNIRLEHIQRAQDCLELIQTKARFSHVIVEHHKRFTCDVRGCVLACAQQLDCQDILLVSHGEEPSILSISEAKHLQQTRLFSLYLLELPAIRRV